MEHTVELLLNLKFKRTTNHPNQSISTSDPAEQETRVIAEVAKNLTSEGREVNLWQIMTKVNSTVRENPNSSLARLMHRDGMMFGKTNFPVHDTRLFCF